MKKQFKLGTVIVGLFGLSLFGMKTPDGIAVAQASERDLAPSPAEPTEGGEGGEGQPEEQMAGNLLANLASHSSNLHPTEAGTLACGPGMVEVEGDYCPVVEQKCVRWLDPESHMRCAEFEAGTSTCLARTTHKHFCIDRFEYPNVAGAKPTVMKDWYEAKSTCESEGKRLCGDTEWTLACEGQERLPYPYGYNRSADACNIDKPHLDVDEHAMADLSKRDAEVARLDQRSPSGSHEACVSPFGAYDMTGNVDEWVVNEGGKPYKSGLKGGYWGPVRDRCRPMTTAHNELFEFYQIGFRCCGDVGSAGGGHVEGHGGVANANTPAPKTAVLAGS
jgi:hypothetical protein